VINASLDLKDLKRAEQVWREAPQRFLATLKNANIRSAGELLRQVVRKVNGELLHVHSGTLRRGFAQSEPKATESIPGWESNVGTAVKYAGYQDHGALKPMDVKAHDRKYGRAVQVRSFGKRSSKISYTNRGVSRVRAHTRKNSYKGVHYVDAAIKDATPKMAQIHVQEIRGMKLDG
jgi:hypothetical protein